ncbi:Zinc finger, B-box [Melia azedarach]|uniref:Zinc finger, B-box n=1 Tax=Melia azedarach TaxID=155640 RepID=A0ACC1WT32_MELAZ|nr:Zinc finger, B-box [Melia azedarach]
MKIQCDVCNKDEASVFCTADEAALCDKCDHRVHHANKLASKHQRFSLVHPSTEQFPLCDVCQEKRAFLFCQQDRAILCRDCDVPIHTANEHTQKHNRFLLTGVKLSATSTLYTSSANNGCDSVPDAKSRSQQSSIKKPVSVALLNSNPSTNPTKISTPTASTTAIVNNSGDSLLASEGGVSTSSISEYLEMLPGWHVEDFLDSSSDPFGFCKSNDGMLPFSDTDFDCNLSSFSSESMGIWVPQAPTPLQPSLLSSQSGGHISFRETKEVNSMKAKNRRYNTDDVFTVPQISPQSVGFKRSRPNFW